MRALLRRQIWRPLHQPFLRYQHDLPHKEYFQTPGQAPVPDVTPYTTPPAFPSSPSYFRRVSRSITWAVLFGTLGLAGGISLLTWDYLQPPFEPGSEEDQEMAEEIEEMMDSHPLVQGLREGGWEERTYNPAHNRFLQTLSGTQGLSLRGFRMPTTGYSILVFYTGSGIEGWPDVIHGGLITTLFNEAASLQLAGLDGVEFPQEHQAVVDFMEPIRPGEIYSILVTPAGPTAPIEEGQTIAQFAVKCLLMRMEVAPEITTEEDELTQTLTNIVAITNKTAVFAEARFFTILAMVTEESQEDAGGQDGQDP